MRFHGRDSSKCPKENPRFYSDAHNTNVNHCISFWTSYFCICNLSVNDPHVSCLFLISLCHCRPKLLTIFLTNVMKSTASYGNTLTWAILAWLPQKCAHAFTSLFTPFTDSVCFLWTFQIWKKQHSKPEIRETTMILIGTLT